MAGRPRCLAIRECWEGQPSLTFAFASKMKKALITVLVVVAIVAAAGVYSVYRGTRVRAAQPCWIKLVSIQAAKEQWAIENHASPGAPVALSDILPYLRAAPTCHVAGVAYIIGKVGEEPKCTTHGTVSNFKPDRY